MNLIGAIISRDSMELVNWPIRSWKRKTRARLAFAMLDALHALKRKAACPEKGSPLATDEFKTSTLYTVHNYRCAYKNCHIKTCPMPHVFQQCMCRPYTEGMIRSRSLVLLLRRWSTTRMNTSHVKLSTFTYFSAPFSSCSERRVNVFTSPSERRVKWFLLPQVREGLNDFYFP